MTDRSLNGARKIHNLPNEARSTTSDAALALAGVATAQELHVAAASNLNHALPELATAFERTRHIHIVASYGATEQLAQQIENGAPMDLYLAADTEHVDELVHGGVATADTRAIYARGRLALRAPYPELKTPADLANPAIRVIVIAKPELARMEKLPWKRSIPQGSGNTGEPGGLCAERCGREPASPIPATATPRLPPPRSQRAKVAILPGEQENSQPSTRHSVLSKAKGTARPPAKSLSFRRARKPALS